jgi:hypothetical protein
MTSLRSDPTQAHPAPAPHLAALGFPYFERLNPGAQLIV